MKKYIFPLNKVLKVKTIELDRLVLQLNQIRNERLMLETKKNELVDLQTQLNEEYMHRINVLLTSFELNQLNYKKENLKLQINQINQKLNEVIRNETFILERVIEKKKEQSTLNKLDEKLYDEHMRLVFKQENAVIDEMLVLKMNHKNG